MLAGDLHSVLAEAGLPVICVETRHMQAALKAQINKTDRNDARGIAQMMRGRTLSSGAREDVTQSEASDAPDHRKLLQSQFNRQASLLHLDAHPQGRISS